jgi:osmotically-inducible protein OsmY
MRRGFGQFGAVFVLVLAGTMASPHPLSAQAPSSPSRADSVLTARVQAALASASDLPADSLTVQARAGVVTVTGSVICADCGGTRTPSGTGTVQQSLGAVVRAVPGVERVLFELRYRSP